MFSKSGVTLLFGLGEFDTRGSTAVNKLYASCGPDGRSEPALIHGIMTNVRRSGGILRLRLGSIPERGVKPSSFHAHMTEKARWKFDAKIPHELELSGWIMTAEARTTKTKDGRIEVRVENVERLTGVGEGGDTVRIDL
jgi:hypothetical protein